MPKVAVAVKPTLWQRVKGEQPVWNMATVWRLAGDESAPHTAQTGATQPSSS